MLLFLSTWLCIRLAEQCSGNKSRWKSPLNHFAVIACYRIRKTEAEIEAKLARGRNERVGPWGGAKRREISDEGRIEGLASLFASLSLSSFLSQSLSRPSLFSLFQGFPPFYARSVRAAGAYSGICSGNLCSDGAQPPSSPDFLPSLPLSLTSSPSLLLPHRFTTCPLTWTNFRMRVSAPTFSATLSFVASCTIDAIGKNCRLGVARQDDLSPRKSRASQVVEARDADPTLIRDVETIAELKLVSDDGTRTR